MRNLTKYFDCFDLGIISVWRKILLFIWCWSWLRQFQM